MDYQEQYKDPRWQKKRLEVLIRDGWQCQWCGSKDKTLHVHHYGYEDEKAIWEQSSKTMITLCEDCHEREGDMVKESLKKLTQILRLYLGHSVLNQLTTAFYHAFNECEAGEYTVCANKPSILVLLCSELLTQQKFQEIILKDIRAGTDIEPLELPDF